MEGTSFNHDAALEELERFHQDIERYRARRRAVGDEFDQFVRSLRSPRRAAPAFAPEPSRGAPALSPPSVKSARDVAAPTAAVSPTMRVAPPPRRPPAKPAPEVAASAATVSPTMRVAPPRVMAAGQRQPERQAPAQVPTKETPRNSRTLLVAALATLVVIGAVAVWMLSPSSIPSPEPSAPSATAALPQAPAAPVSAVPAVAAGVTELTTTRTVWVRVTADGERVLEKRLPADSRIPLEAVKTLTIRTGDAGAVRLTIAGQDQGPLGRSGQVITRTFAIGK